MKYDQLSDKEKELIDLFNQADSDTQDLPFEKYVIKHTSLFFSADQLPYLSVYVSLQLCLVLIICILAKPCELDALNI